MSDTDIIGGFPVAEPNCQGCGQPLTVENAWMTDGCPCNSELGVNSMNETRWRLLMQLQQRQQHLCQTMGMAEHTPQQTDTAKPVARSSLLEGERLRRAATALIDSLVRDSPGLIIAMHIRSVLSTGLVSCGEDLVGEIGKWLIENARMDHGLCQSCDTPISPPQHKQGCADCNAKHDAFINEVLSESDLPI